MNPSLVLPELLVRGNITPSVSSSVNFERLSSESPLVHYRFCRSLLNQARHSISLPGFAHAFESALNCPCARRYQPSISALWMLSHILGKPLPEIHASLYPSGAPIGDREEISQVDRLLPLPIARELVQLWEEIGALGKDEKLIERAHQARLWMGRWGHSVDYLFYCEKEFDEQEIHNETKGNLPISLKEMEKNHGSDKYLGIARFSIPAFHALFTLSGWNSGLGSMKFGNVEIRSFGPHGFPLSDPAGFGLAQVSAHQMTILADSEHLSLSGWSRCYQNKEIWVFINAAADMQAVRMDVRWAGLKSNLLSEKPFADPYALVFYVKASTCTLEDGSILYPKGLHRYQGKCQKIVFDQEMQIECSQILNVQIIPLAGFACFWNATFLVAFEFSPSQDQAFFSFRGMDFVRI